MLERLSTYVKVAYNMDQRGSIRVGRGLFASRGSNMFSIFFV